MKTVQSLYLIDGERHYGLVVKGVRRFRRLHNGNARIARNDRLHAVSVETFREGQRDDVSNDETVEFDRFYAALLCGDDCCAFRNSLEWTWVNEWIDLDSVFYTTWGSIHPSMLKERMQSHSILFYPSQTWNRF